MNEEITKVLMTVKEDACQWPNEWITNETEGEGEEATKTMYMCVTNESVSVGEESTQWMNEWITNKWDKVR
jgi:hypothetical protein